MLDYNNGIDVGVEEPLIKDENCYILTLSAFYGWIFARFPIDKSQINIENVKQNAMMLQKSILSTLSIIFYWGLFDSITNIDQRYNNIIGVFWHYSSTQITVMYFNTKLFSFESMFVITMSNPFYVFNFKNYNSTLIYAFGAENLYMSNR